MIELSRGNFPAVVVVALQAVLSESAFMLILVASHTCGRNSQKGLVQIFELDTFTFRSRHVFRGVATIADQARVFALKRVTGLLVVKGLDVPLDQREIYAIVLRVAASAVLA